MGKRMVGNKDGREWTRVKEKKKEKANEKKEGEMDLKEKVGRRWEWRRGEGRKRGKGEWKGGKVGECSGGNQDKEKAGGRKGKANGQ